MNDKPDMFDALLTMGPSPGVTDTSTAAAEKIKPKHGTLARTVFNIIDNNGQYGATTTEISILSGRNYRGIQPRTSELKKMKLVFDSGDRRKNEFDNQEIVWVSKFPTYNVKCLNCDWTFNAGHIEWDTFICIKCGNEINNPKNNEVNNG